MRKKCLYFYIIFFAVILYLSIDILNDNRIFSSISRDIVQNESNPIKKAILINNWAHKNIKLTPHKIPNIIQTPKFILRKGGVCGSFAKITAVLMREQGIPARLLFIYYRGVPTHVITEAYIKGKWRVFDPDFGYIYFGKDSLPETADDIVKNPDIMKRVIDAKDYPDRYILRDVRRTNWTKIPGGNVLYKFLKKRIGKRADWICINVITLRPKILSLDILMFFFIISIIVYYIKIFRNKFKKT